ncbi:MAG: hypothetical protein K8S27_00345 [Candidatus Omnitrophica bacterium]|nr:hypothetical protein [Candidatus Omnitrophota bacterium]
MQKYYCKIRKWIVFFLFLICAHILVSQYATREMQTYLYRTFQHRIKITSVSYRFPHSFIIKGIHINADNQIYQTPIIFIPRLKITFSFWEVLLQKQFDIYRVTVYKPTVYARRINNLLMDQELINKFNSVPGPEQSCCIHLEQVKWTLYETAAMENYFKFNYHLKFDRDHLSGYGDIKAFKDFYDVAKRKLVETHQIVSFKSHLDGFTTEDGFFLKEMALTNDDREMYFWGSVFTDAINLKGKVIDHVYVEDHVGETGQNRRNGGVNKLTSFFKEKTLLKSNQKLVRLDSHFQLYSDRIVFDHLRFSFDGYPVLWKGEAQFSDPIHIKGTFSHAPRAESVLSSKIKITQHHIDGHYSKKQLVGRWSTSVTLSEKVRDKVNISDVGIAVDNSTISVSDDNDIQIKARNGNIFIKRNDRVNRVLFDDFHLNVDVRGPSRAKARLSADLYQGRMTGDIDINFVQVVPKISGNIEMEQVNLDKVHHFVYDLSHLKGKAKANFEFSTYPGFDAKGNLFIQNGSVENNPWSDWVARYFDLPAFEHIDFKEMSLCYTFRPGLYRLRDIRIRSEEINLDADFRMNDQDLISSHFSLDVGRPVLSDSSNFRALLKRLGKDVNSVSFDFRLAGSPDLIHFEWSETDMKEQIKGKIPRFIQRRIEREIEKLIAGEEDT